VGTVLMFLGAVVTTAGLGTLAASLVWKRAPAVAAA
jgi:hypothetical protein